MEQEKFDSRRQAATVRTNKLSDEYLRRGLARELCAFVIAAKANSPTAGLRAQDMLNSNSSAVWWKQALLFDETVDAMITLGFVAVRCLPCCVGICYDCAAWPTVTAL